MEQNETGKIDISQGHTSANNVWNISIDGAS